MGNDFTLDFYNRQARGYAAIRARPIQQYTDRAERAALSPLIASSNDILDLGCGEGRLTRWIAEEKSKSTNPFTVVGADFSPAMISHAKQQNDNLPATYVVEDASSLTFADNSFDLIVSCTAPNNFPDLSLALDEAHRILRPGGVFFATIINKQEAARFARYIYYSPYYLLHFIQRQFHKDMRDYQRTLYSQDEIETLVSQKFDIEALTGLRIVPDFFPEFPLNIFPPFFPIMRLLLRSTETLDASLSSNALIGQRARFHLVIAKNKKDG